MKKRLLILTLVLVLPLYSCGSPTPTDVTEEFLTAIKTNDTETLKATYAGDNMDMEGALKRQDIDVEDADKLLKEEVIPKLQSFEYEVSGEKIDGSNATVQVKLKTYGFGKAFTAFSQEYFKQAFANLLSGSYGDGSAIPTNNDELATDIFLAKLKGMKKDFVKTVTLKLIEKDGEWIVDAIKDSDDFFDALSGGLVSATTELFESFAKE